MTQETAGTIAREYFEQYPTVGCLYVTTDEQVFFQPDHAAIHARSLGSEVRKVERPEMAEVEAKVETEVEVKVEAEVEAEAEAEAEGKKAKKK